MANVNEMVLLTLIPINSAAPLSSLTARIAFPSFVVLINKSSKKVQINVKTKDNAETYEMLIDKK